MQNGRGPKSWGWGPSLRGSFLDESLILKMNFAPEPDSFISTWLGGEEDFCCFLSPHNHTTTQPHPQCSSQNTQFNVVPHSDSDSVPTCQFSSPQKSVIEKGAHCHKIHLHDISLKPQAVCFIALCCYPNVKWEIGEFHHSTHFLAF